MNSNAPPADVGCTGPSGSCHAPEDGHPLDSACFCVTLDRTRLLEQAREALQDRGLAQLLQDRWGHAFADLPIFLPDRQARRMVEVVRAIEEVVALPAWQDKALDAAPEIARHSPRGAKGVFLGYDFHVAGDETGLIEINTNAGGALVNPLLARAQRTCCPWMVEASSTQGRFAPDAFEEAIVGMFRSEWRAAEGNRPLRTVAIVDQDPQAQYLYSEFLLFQRLLRRYGIEAVVAGRPGGAVVWEGGLQHGGTAIDLVYNRLTDFYLDEVASAAVRSAYLHNAVVLTPHPRAHALYADKRRLAWLSDAQTLQALGVPQARQELLLAAVPRTVLLTPQNAAELWTGRRGLIFKPVRGFGGRAAYRGEKLTKSAWSGIVAGEYVAQALVEPGRRPRAAAAEEKPLKFDLRNYVYDREVQWLAARLYQGQTTNFRTEGGGFAPVYTLADTASLSAAQPAGAKYASYVFLLDAEGRVRPVPHALCVALARDEVTGPQLAGWQVRVADWHVRLRDGAPEAVVREWYGWARFDREGRFDPAFPQPADAHRASGNVDASAFPTEQEYQRMKLLLFPAKAS